MFERFPIDLDSYHAEAQAGPCFVCRIVAGDAAYPADVIYEDGLAIAFLDKYPTFLGYTLLAPKRHKTQATGDFTVEEYADLQRRLHRVAEAVRLETGAERLYLLSLGSEQGHAHVHWHIVPLPPGVPYRQQQLAALRQDPLRVPPEEQAALAARLRARLECQARPLR